MLLESGILLRTGSSVLDKNSAAGSRGECVGLVGGVCLMSSRPSPTGKEARGLAGFDIYFEAVVHTVC
jgi:hypothetical protein